MTDHAGVKPLDEFEGKPDSAQFAELRAQARPVVIRGLVDNWPLVEAARSGDAAFVSYLCREPTSRPVRAIIAPPSAGGRFFYKDDMSALNFQSGRGRLEMFLQDLLKASEVADPPAMAVQSEKIGELLPHVAAENRLDPLPDVEARIWIGNRIRVAPHYDVKENVACCVAGRRRFTLFPPDQIANLYPGPFELTPAGTPVSMVDIADPDFDRYPGFREALASAEQATLDPGDAIYIPYCWWHGVESLDPVSVLVNYWWTEGQPEGVGSPYDALFQALYSIRHMPEDQREAWRILFDYYIFDPETKAGQHLPADAQGVLGPARPELFAAMRQMLQQKSG